MDVLIINETLAKGVKNPEKCLVFNKTREVSEGIQKHIGARALLVTNPSPNLVNPQNFHQI